MSQMQRPSPTKYAPIVLFVFARPEHTRLTLEALRANTLAKKTDLIVYADAARNSDEIYRVNQVRMMAHTAEGFRSVTVIERESNYGLARNIIEGVTAVCERYGKVIVLEDDIVTSPAFLQYVNDALERYEDAPEVWHISGWNYPIDNRDLPETFLWRTMNCWGWATWADRWTHFRKDPSKLIKSWDKDMIRRFNLDQAHDFWSQVLANQKHKLNTWAIFWYATIFSHGGLCLNPSKSLVLNIGHDGSGENCGNADIFANQLARSFQKGWPSELEENSLALNRIKQFYKDITPSFPRRALRKIKRIFFS